jgi:hypothetical protein
MASSFTHQAGDLQVAGDIYGTGVRVGIYLQVFGLLFSGVVGKGRGIKLACGATLLALLISRTEAVRNRIVSPAESVIVLGLGFALVYPIQVAMICEDSWAGEGIAMTCCLIATLWLSIADICFAAKFYASLPALGTSGLTWSLTQVHINDRSYRVGSIIGDVVAALINIAFLYYDIGYIYVGAKAWRKGEDSPEIPISEREQLQRTRGIYFGVFLLCEIFFIAQVEMTIKWNGLQPDGDFSHPGQSIPVVVGAFVLADGLMALVSTPWIERGGAEDMSPARV